MLSTLELTQIRSYENGLFEFANGVNIVVGPNASGKTNLLESIYMAAQGSAFKSDDLHMIHRDYEWGRIDAHFDEHERVIKLKKTTKEKQFVLDGVDRKRLTSANLFPVVLFEPSHMLLLGGEPERRRTYLDSLIAQVVPVFHRTVADYKRTLAQRNRLLKSELLQPEHLFVWDVRLSELAGSLVEKRLEYVLKINDMLTQNYQAVSGNQESLLISYESKIDISQYTTMMLRQLQASFELDRARGFTGVGPHRDDLHVAIDGNDVRENASRGETRSVVLALKIAELSILEQYHDLKPLLLLDDVFSELDGRRRRLLAERLQSHQTFITTTDADAIIKSFLKGYNVISTS